MHINLIKRFYLLFVALFFPITNAMAANKTVMEYFATNPLIEFIVSGGYYSLAVIAVLAIICIAHEKTRNVVLSVILALFGLLLVLFTFESLNDIKLM